MIRRLLRVVGVFLGFQIGLLVLILIPTYLYYHFRDKAQASNTTWGVTFSPAMSTSLGLDWKANYLAILNDLKPDGLRLIAAWDVVEPAEASFDYADLDWEMEEAAAHGTKVILSFGQKVPRWPECHIPTWTSGEASVRQHQLLAYARETVERYKGSSALQYWQVENEPNIAYGACDQLDLDMIDPELALTRSLDSLHPIMMTDGGEWGAWYQSALRGDVFGTTMYRHVYDHKLDTAQTNWLPPEYYAAKADLMRLLTNKPDLPVIVSELGEEPWGNKQIQDMTLAEDETFISPHQFDETLRYAMQTGFDTYYLWGAEWWYYAKEHGQSAYWDTAKQVFSTNQVPAP